MGDHEGRAPAPGGLRLLEAFVNSLDYPSGPDQLGTPAECAAWLSSEGISVARPPSAADCRSLQDLRERLRDLLEANTGRAVSDESRAEVGRLLADAPLRVRVGRHGTTLAPAADGVDELRARIAAAMVEATVARTWPRLKVCAADTCRFAFYDHSKNGSGTWCAMRVCGSRAKARAYRERRREQPAPA